MNMLLAGCWKRHAYDKFPAWVKWLGDEIVTLFSAWSSNAAIVRIRMYYSNGSWVKPMQLGNESIGIDVKWLKQHIVFYYAFLSHPNMQAFISGI